MARTKVSGPSQGLVDIVGTLADLLSRHQQQTARKSTGGALATNPSVGLDPSILIVIHLFRQGPSQAAHHQGCQEDRRRRKPTMHARRRLVLIPPRRPPLVVSRSPIASSLVPSPSVKAVATRSPRSCSSASSPSSVSFVRSLRTSRFVPCTGLIRPLPC